MYYRPYHDREQNNELGPVFATGELETGTWVEIVPQRLQMVIVETGLGPTPAPGQFLRVKQFTYLENMRLVRKERAHLHYGRGKLIQGLEACLGLCREGFKGRFIINGSLAYEEDQPRIPKKSAIVIDLELLGITNEPIGTGVKEDNMLIDEVMELDKIGEAMIKLGDLSRAQWYFDRAYDRIQSSRSSHIKGYLLNINKLSGRLMHNDKSQEQIETDQQFLLQLFKAWDSVRLKSIEVAHLNKDYLRVVIMSKQLMMESRLQDNPRILVLRARALAEVGDFPEAIVPLSPASS